MKYYYDIATSEVEGYPVWHGGWCRPFGKTPSEGRKYRAHFCAANLTLLKRKIKPYFAEFDKVADLDGITKEQLTGAGYDGVSFRLGEQSFKSKAGKVWTMPKYIKIFAV